MILRYTVVRLPDSIFDDTLQINGFLEIYRLRSLRVSSNASSWTISFEVFTTN